LVNTPTAATNIAYFSFRASNNEWYVADRATGFWKSLNQGGSWTQINSGLSSITAQRIQVNPANGDLIGATFKSGSGALGDYWRSTNDGAAWTKIPLGYQFNFADSIGCVFPTNSLVCGGYWAPSPKTGVFRSNDGGATVTQGIVTPNNQSALGIGLNPIDNILWMGTEQRGVYNSTDGGLTWNQKSASSSSLDPINGVVGYGNALYFEFDRSGNVLWAAQGGVWKGTKSGSTYTWAKVLNNTTNKAQGRSLGHDRLGNLYYGHDIDPLLSTTAYRSTDNGTTWSAFDTGLPQFLEDTEFIENPNDNKLYTVVGNEATAHWSVYRTALGPLAPTNLTVTVN
jgi:hypothetical protein